MSEMTSGFRVLGNEIVDASTGEPVSPADFNARSTPDEKDRIGRELVARGAMTNQRGEGGSDLLEEEDAQLGGDDEAPAAAQPVAQQDAPAPATLPEPKTARPSLQHFMEVMKPRHPKADDRELHRYWAQHYSDIDPKTLPSFETFLPAVKERNPTLSDEDARTYWDEHYGDFGAAEKNAPAPGFLGTMKDMGLKAAAGVVDVAQSAVGLASLASGGKAGEILRDLGWNPEEANKFLNSKTSEAQQAADRAVSDAKGFIETVVAYAQNPRAIAGGVAEAAPGIASMGLAARKAATMIAEKAAAAYGGLATAEGAAAASKAVEAAAGKLMWVSSGTEGALSAGQIADQAQGAGREYSDYLLPSLAGGVGTAAIGRAAGGLMGSAEIPLFTGSKAGAISGNFVTRTAKSIFSEGFLEEMPQSAQEQVFQNLAMGKPWSEGVPEAAASGAVIGSAMGGVMGGVQRPTPPPQEEELPEPQRQGPQLPQAEGPQLPQRLGPNLPEQMGPFQPQAEGPQAPQPFGPTLPEALGPQLEKALGPSNEPHGPYRPTVKDVIGASSLDEAIEATQGLINTFEVPNTGGPEKRPFIEPTVLPGAAPVEPPLIQPGSAFSPRQEPTPEEPSLREKLNFERLRLEEMRVNRPVMQPETLEPPMPTGDEAARETALPSALDKAYPSLDQVKHLAESKGVSTSVLSAIVQQTTGAKTIDELSPTDLQRLSDRLSAIKASTPPAVPQPAPEAPADLFQQPAATAPLPIKDAVKVPRHELAPEQNEQLLTSAELADHDLTMMGDDKPSLGDFLIEKGGIQDQGEEVSAFDVDKELKPGKKKLIREGGLTLDQAAELAHDEGLITDRDRNTLLQAIDDEHRGHGYSKADWYIEATTGPNKLTRERVDAAIQKIIADQGRDTGKDVERIKAILLQEQAAPEQPVAPLDAEKAKLEASRWNRRAQALIDQIKKLDDRLARYQAGNVPVSESDRTAVRSLVEQVDALPDEVDHALKDEARRNVTSLQNAVSRSDQHHGVKPAQQDTVKPGQQEIAVPPPTSGERPIIGREPTKEEAPLFSLAAQEPDAEQGGLSFDEKPEPEQPSKIQQEKDKLEAMRPDKASLIPTRHPDGSIEWVAKPQEPEPKPSQSDAIKQLLSGRDGKLPDAPSESAYVRAVTAVADAVLEQLKAKSIITTEWLLKQADTAFGGTRAAGTYTEKDAYEALEMGVNRYILHELPRHVNASAFKTDAHLFIARDTYNEIHKQILSRLPAQRPARTEDQNEFQQFSTIPDLAYVMHYAAAIHGNDVMLEPSAGLGGLASFAKAAGATVYVNEYHANRAALLKTMGFDRVFTENAEQLNNVLPDDVKPTVIVMNPPFSSTAGRMEGQRDSRNVLRHLDQALARLQPGGRLVALIGMGRNGKDPQYLEEWIDATAKKYAYRARIRLSGEGYKKYGTKYDNQFLVFDKITPDGTAPVVTPTLATSFEALNLLAEVRNVRPVSAQPASTQSGSQAPSPGSQGRPDERPAVPPTTDVVGPGAGQARPGPRGGAGSSRPSGTRSPGSAGRPGQGSGAGVSLEGDRRPSGEPATQPTHDADRPDAGGSGVPGAGQSGQPGQRRPEPGTELPERLSLDAADETHAPAPEKADAVFETYRPKKVQIAGAHAHPGQLVESTAMSAVEPPAATYRPTLPKEVITEGRLSLPQLESTVYAGQAHQEFLPSGERQGFFNGDGTGVGKGREIAGLILDNMMQGRKKAVWLSKGENLFSSAVRDWQAVAGKGRADVFSQGPLDLNGKIEQKEGVLFTYYSLIGSGLDLSPKGELEAKKDEHGKQAAQTRFSQLRDWLGKDFDGVIVFDEAHEMRNNMTTESARGDKKPAMKALAGVELQKLFPKARVAYFSATGGIEVSDFGYAERLGMWGPGTAFPTKQAFVGGIQAGGMATMEVVAQDLKANGLYLSRSLSYDDVTYERLTHELTPIQKEQYDALARGWQIIIRNIRAALHMTGAAHNGNAKSRTFSALWGAQLRFFDQILVTMQMPSVLARMRKELDAGNAVVASLTKTNESGLKREIKARKAEGASLDDLDLTPRQMMLGYLKASFPVQEYEDFIDDNGNIRSRPVTDSEGRPVENKEAVAARDQLIEDLGLLKFPDPAMEQIINAFGYENIAEVTGRHVRVVKQEQDDGSPPKGVHQKRTKAITLKEAQEFQDDKRSVLIFSDAGGTGQSYHADNTAKNQRRRIHFPIQPGWRADAAMQALGRTHRTNQASAPHYILPSTDLRGHNRFISTIARRLAQLGALTKGSRQASTQGLFSERDNLENAYATGTIRTFFQDLLRGDLGRFGWSDLVEKLGMDETKLLNEGNLVDSELPDVPKFLNRLLTLEYADQNDAFDLFMARMDRSIEMAKANGTFEAGMENYRADSATVTHEQIVHTDQRTKATTKLVQFATHHRINYLPYQVVVKKDRFQGFYTGTKTGKLYATYAGYQHTKEDGEIEEQIKLQEPDMGKYRLVGLKTFQANYVKVMGDAEKKWKEAIATAPARDTQTVRLLSGALLRIWDRLPKTHTRVFRIVTDDGRRVVGRLVPDNELDITLERLGVEGEKEEITVEKMLSTIEEGGTVEMANGWKIGERRVNQEDRLELWGLNLAPFKNELKQAGLFTESIRFETRFFIPLDQAKEILQNITQHRPVLRLNRKQRGGTTSSQTPAQEADEEDGLSSAQENRTDPAPPSRKANFDPHDEEAQAVQRGIEGKTVLQAAQFIATQAPTPAYREIGQRIAEKIKQLQQAGMQFELIVAHRNDTVPAPLLYSRGLTYRVFNSNVTQVYIQGADVTGYIGMSYETVLHELVHAVTQTAVHVGSLVSNRGTEIHTLVGDLRALHSAIIDHYNAKVKSGKPLTDFEQRSYNRMHNALKNPDELLAWGLTNPDMQAFLEGITYQGSTLWNSFVDAIRRFLGLQPKANTALSEVLRIADSLMEFPVGEYALLAAQANLPMATNQHEALSSDQTDDGLSSAQQSMAGLIDKAHAKDRLKAATTQARPYLLGSLGLHQLATVYGKDHREVATYNQASQQMETDFVEITRESDEILQHWDKLKVNVADRMARVMEQARFANYDPDPQVNHAKPDDPNEQAIRDAFNDLPDEAKAVYRESRDFYSAMADRRFNAIAGRIERSGGTPENQKAALDKLKLAYDQVRAKVYFPFTRFGEHIVIARQMVNGVEKDREVSAFESPLEAQQFATMMKARGWKVKQTLAKEYSRDQEGAASKAVREILDIVEGLDEQNPRAKDQLLDAINQTFIHALPDMSYAKHFTHAKDVKGFSKDALRAFAHSALHGAHHISRIQNADFLTRALASMDERINDEDEGDVTEARQVHNELTLRHNDLLNPNVSPVTAWLGQLGFTMSLGGVIATGVTNATQVPLITLPWLGARYGFGKAGAHLARAYKDFLDPATLNSDSLFDASKSARLTGAERAMLKELQRRGRIDLTQTMDLSGRASQDNLSRVARQHGSIQDKIAKMLGFTFHAPEVMNRQVTAIATYRMEMTRTVPGERPDQKHDRAVAQAEAAIIDTHFIYTQENRPRYMSGNVMRVLTMFKQYGQNIAFLYGRSAQLWLTQTQATAEEKAIAKKQLLSMAGLQFAAAGALGMPFVGTVASLFTALLNGFGDDDDKKEWEVELRKYLAEAVGKETGEVLSHGVSRLTPWDMAARVGQADLFFRAPQREREGRAAAMDWITSLSGPVLGYAVNAYLGVGDMAKGIQSADTGHFLRGVEEMTPALIRNQVKALRYELEGGIQSRDHHHQLDVSGAEALGQFFGFAPSRGAEMYEGMTAIKNYERRLAGRRADLLDAYAAAYEAGDSDRRAEIMADVKEFNAKHRELAINGDTLLKSLRGRRKRDAATVGGVYLPRKRDNLRQEGNFANY